jgi:hypothetical protein
MTFSKGRYKYYVQIRIVNILRHIRYAWSILKEIVQRKVLTLNLHSY